MRPSHLLDAKAGAPILRIGASLVCKHTKAGADNPVPGLSASKDFSKKDNRNGEG